MKNVRSDITRVKEFTEGVHSDIRRVVRSNDLHGFIMYLRKIEFKHSSIVPHLVNSLSREVEERSQ
jgi:hypothetical protein